MGINEIFAYRVELPFIYDGALNFHQIPRKPDRVIGLKATKNLQSLLAQPLHPRFGAPGRQGPVRGVLQSSPFENEQDPLLFPFLLLEAKQDSAPRGFWDIETQSAFPIREILKIQKDLQSGIPQDWGSPEPLAWFLGHSSSHWRVYGCYMVTEPGKEPEYVSTKSVCLKCPGLPS